MLPSVFRSRRIWVVIISVTIIAGTVGTYLYVRNSGNGDINPPDLPVSHSTVDLNSTLNLMSNEYYKGDALNFSLGIDVNDTANLVNITLKVLDQIRSRFAEQTVSMNVTLDKGVNSISLLANPFFNENGFVALNTQNFTITQYRLGLENGQIFSGEVDLDLKVMLHEEYDLAPSVTWEEELNENITYTNEPGKIEFNTTSNPGEITLNTTINANSYTRIYFNRSQSFNCIITDDTLHYNISTSGYISVGRHIGNMTLELFCELPANSSMVFNYSIPTRKTVLYAVVASNNWESIPGDENAFFEPGYYISQASSRFRSAMNLTIIPVVQVDFESNSGSDLLLMKNEALAAVGTALELPGNSWNFTIGTSPDNAGADILIVMTNKTMNNLGVVIGTYGGANNAAINAQGSLNSGNYPLTSSLADNLLQHELSHIFGAPDRWTESDPASVMTKSRVPDAWGDIISGRFWLFRVDWLEVDIQTMYDHVYLYRE